MCSNFHAFHFLSDVVSSYYSFVSHPCLVNYTSRVIYRRDKIALAYIIILPSLQLPDCYMLCTNNLFYSVDDDNIISSRDVYSHSKDRVIRGGKFHLMPGTPYIVAHDHAI